MRKHFPNSGLEVIQNDFYYLVINHKKGGSFRLITKAGSYTDAGILKKISEQEVGILKGMIFNKANFFLGWLPIYRKLLRKYLRGKVVKEREYEPREIEINERQIIVRGPIGAKAAYTGNQSSRYFSVAELDGAHLIPNVNGNIRTFTF